jgi:hypothetical protein
MPALTMLGIVLGVVVFVVLTVSVAAWWVAAVIGLGLIVVLSMIDGLSHYNRERSGRGAYS